MKVRPCPWCKSTAGVIITGSYVTCRVCEHSVAGGITAWNAIPRIEDHEAAMQTKDAEIARLRKVADAARVVMRDCLIYGETEANVLRDALEAYGPKGGE